jgi:hypothetical protein
MLYRQNGALVALGTVGVLGVLGAVRKRGSTSGPKYTFRSDSEEWFEFLTGGEREMPSGDSEDPEELTEEDYEVQRAYENRIWDLLSEADFDYENEEIPDHFEVAFLTWATDMGHGIGLWEEREPWHARFWEIAKVDAELNRLSRELTEIDMGRDPAPPSIRDLRDRPWRSGSSAKTATKKELITNILLLSGAYGWKVDDKTGLSQSKNPRKELQAMSKSDLVSLFDIVQTQTKG